MTLPMPWSELTALLLFATAMAFTPGPNTTLAAALAANRGLAHAMRFVCAVPVGWGLLLLGTALGLGALLAAVPVLRGAIKAAGLGYMLWLAWKLSRSGVLPQAAAVGGGEGFSVGFAQGGSATVTQPTLKPSPPPTAAACGSTPLRESFQASHSM